MTNAEKFEEVFGFKPDIHRHCVVPMSVCEKMPNCRTCPFYAFWDKEYKECFVLRDEYKGDE